MSDLLRLLVLIPLGYVVANAAAAVTVATASFGSDSGLRPSGLVIVSGVMMFYAGAASFVPSLLAIAASELWRIRSVFFFLIFGGALGYVIHQFAPFAGPVEMYQQRALAFPAAVFVGGAVYWFIAGRMAGIGRNRRQDGPA